MSIWTSTHLNIHTSEHLHKEIYTHEHIRTWVSEHPHIWTSTHLNIHTPEHHRSTHLKITDGHIWTSQIYTSEHHKSTHLNITDLHIWTSQIYASEHHRSTHLNITDLHIWTSQIYTSKEVDTEIILSAKKCQYCWLFWVLFSVLSLFLVQHTSATLLCHEAITVQVTTFWVCSTFFGFQLEVHDVNLVKLWTGKSMNIYHL